jgi:drug/metabolite transporter (DMT)-like permease
MTLQQRSPNDTAGGRTEPPPARPRIDITRRRAGRADLRAYLGVLVATLVWGTLHPVGKVALQDVTPAQLVLARALLTGLTLVALLAVRGQLWRLVETARSRPLPIAGLGLLSFFGSSGLSMTGLSFLPASVNSLLSNTSPLMLALGLAVARGRLPGPRVLLGLSLGLAGVTMLSARGAADLGAVGLVGVCLSLGGSLTWAIYTGWSRRELQGGDPIAITAGAALVGSVPLLALVALSGGIPTLAAAPPQALWLLLYMGVIGTALTYGLWMTGLRRLSATNVSAFQYVIPLNAVLVSIVALGEPLTPALALGGAAILAGVALAQQRG